MAEPLPPRNVSVYDQAVALLQQQSILPRLIILQSQILLQAESKGHRSPVPDVEDLCAALRFKGVPIAAVGEPDSVSMSELNTAGLRNVQLEQVSRSRADYGITEPKLHEFAALHEWAHPMCRPGCNKTSPQHWLQSSRAWVWHQQKHCSSQVAQHRPRLQPKQVWWSRRLCRASHCKRFTKHYRLSSVKVWRAGVSNRNQGSTCQPPDEHTYSIVQCCCLSTPLQ